MPQGRLHIHRPPLSGPELNSLLQHAGPNAAAVVTHLHRPHVKEFAALGRALTSGFGLFLASWLLFSLAVSSFASLYPLLMLNSFHITVAQSALLILIATAVSIPLYNFAGRLTLRFGPASVLAIGIGVRMAGLVGLALVVNLLQPAMAILPAIVFFGAYQGIWPLSSVASNDLAAGLAPFGEGSAMGLVNATAAIASAVGAIVGGKVADILGYPAVSLFAAIGALLALGCVALLLRTSRASPQA